MAPVTKSILRDLGTWKEGLRSSSAKGCDLFHKTAIGKKNEALGSGLKVLLNAVARGCRWAEPDADELSAVGVGVFR